MKPLRRFKPSPAMVVACLALLVALGGTSYAAVQALPRNSVTTLQVKDFSLLGKDFKRGQIPRGPAGPAGPTGPAGPAGPQGPAGPSGSASLKWALVRPDGGIEAQSGGITVAVHASAGNYILNFGSSAAGKPILASGGYAGSDTSDQRSETTAGLCGGGTQGRSCPSGFDNTNHVWVQTRSTDGTYADRSFYVVVIG